MYYICNRYVLYSIISPTCCYISVFLSFLMEFKPDVVKDASYTKMSDLFSTLEELTEHTFFIFSLFLLFLESQLVWCVLHHKNICNSNTNTAEGDLIQLFGLHVTSVLKKNLVIQLLYGTISRLKGYAIVKTCVFAEKYKNGLSFHSRHVIIQKYRKPPSKTRCMHNGRSNLLDNPEGF